MLNGSFVLIRYLFLAMVAFHIDEVVFFGTAAEFRTWLEEHHDTAPELWVGYYKKENGNPNMTWSESVDQAICFGWIDGIRKSIDGDRYTIRFTPRNPKSIWSALNIKKVEMLTQQGLMHKSGLRAFHQWEAKNSDRHSFERDHLLLSSSDEAKFKENEKAWNFFHTQAPSYRKTAVWWVISARQEQTRLKRRETLIRDSEAGQKIAPLRR